ncbi:hypothetical protein [Dongshaea marina]|uniref:hypothetical protein n=1 Tax=Dongshaea marina TaxID=2047966 RepID=UPI00131EE144|nr:hypothetical protein [Dongshaea marina]
MANTRNKHGTYSIELDSNIVIMRAYGSWNLEQAEAYCHDLCENYVSHIEHSPWGLVGDLTEWGLCTPEAMQRFEQLAEELSNRNQYFQAAISQMKMQQSLAREYATRAGHLLTVKHFHDFGEGLRWCKEQLANLNR